MLRAPRGAELQQKQCLRTRQGAGNGPWSRGSAVKRSLGLDEGRLSDLQATRDKHLSCAALLSQDTERQSFLECSFPSKHPPRREWGASTRFCSGYSEGPCPPGLLCLHSLKKAKVTHLVACDSFRSHG